MFSLVLNYQSPTLDPTNYTFFLFFFYFFIIRICALLDFTFPTSKAII